MQFIKRIGDGEITIEDNKVLELSPAQKTGNAWAEEFTQNQHPGVREGKAEAWVGEFENEAQFHGVHPAASNQWASEYLDRSVAEVLNIWKGRFIKGLSV